MSKDDLASKVKEFADIADTLPEQYQKICFDRMLTVYLQEGSKALKRTDAPSNSRGSVDIGDYSDIVAIEEEEVKVLAELPGANLKEKSVSAALLVLYSKLCIGQSDIATSEIRKVCESHAALDKKNFASHLKGARSLFLLSGRGRGMTAKLTEPGKKKAKKMLVDMASACE